jgi:hypothetical protein
MEFMVEIHTSVRSPEIRARPARRNDTQLLPLPIQITTVEHHASPALQAIVEQFRESTGQQQLHHRSADPARRQPTGKITAACDAGDPRAAPAAQTA